MLARAPCEDHSCTRVNFSQSDCSSITLSCPGFVKAHDWSLIITVLAIWATRGTVPDLILHVFFRYCDVIRRLLVRRVQFAELDALDNDVVECLCLVEAHLPRSNFHLLVHAVFYFKLWGPFASYWMYPFERFLGFLGAAVTNRSRPEATLTRFYLHFETARSHRREIEQFFAASDVAQQYATLRHRSRRTDSDREVMTPRFSPHEAQLAGPVSTSQLPDSDRPHLIQMLRMVVDDYNRACTAYDEDRAEHTDRKTGRVSVGFPDIGAWIPPAALGMTKEDEQWLLGPSSSIRKAPRCVIGGVEFRSAEAETKLTTRNSYFRFFSELDGKILTEYGRLLYICEVDIAEHTIVCAKVDIYKGINDEPVCTDFKQHSKKFTLSRIDTTKTWKNRRFIPLNSLAGKVILAPPDSRLDSPLDRRLDGPCFVLPFTDCVRPKPLVSAVPPPDEREEDDE